MQGLEATVFALLAGFHNFGTIVSNQIGLLSIEVPLSHEESHPSVVWIHEYWAVNSHLCYYLWIQMSSQVWNDIICFDSWIFWGNSDVKKYFLARASEPRQQQRPYWNMWEDNSFFCRQQALGQLHLVISRILANLFWSVCCRCMGDCFGPGVYDMWCRFVTVSCLFLPCLCQSSWFQTNLWPINSTVINLKSGSIFFFFMISVC